VKVILAASIRGPTVTESVSAVPKPSADTVGAAAAAATDRMLEDDLLRARGREQRREQER
jgi:hypothetical protein